MRRLLIGICLSSAFLVLGAESKGQVGPPARRLNESDNDYVKRSSFRMIEDLERGRSPFPVQPRSNIAPLWRDWGAKAHASDRPKTLQPRPTSFQVLSDREYFAPNLKIHFRLVGVGHASGVQLTRKPSPDSGALHIWVNGSWVYLEPNDVIYNLDSLPIRDAVDAMNHHGQTTLAFIDHRTGRDFRGVMTLPPYTPLPDGVPHERFASNLGMHYQLIPLGRDTFRVRLSRTAPPGTPAGALGLERGDMIRVLAGEPIRQSEDILNHYGLTSVEFINVRTGGKQVADILLPEMAR
jgi:hypothetical protein